MLDDTIKNIITLAKKYPVISRVGVFGSYARGEQTADSDIDVLFDYNKANDDDTDFVLDILNYADELSKEFGKMNLNLDCVSYKGVMRSTDNKVRESIISSVMWIYNRGV